MANDTGTSGRITEKGPITRSTRETLSKKVVVNVNPSSTPNRKSERLKKRTPPTLAVKSKSENQKQKITHSPLRRSERTRNPSASVSPSPSSDASTSSTSRSSDSKKHKSAKQLTFEASEDEEDVENSTSSKLKVKKRDSRSYRTNFRKRDRDCCEESNMIDKSTLEAGDGVGGKIDECFKGNSFEQKTVSKDGILPSENAKAKDTSTESRLSEPVKELIENNVILGSSVPSDSTAQDTGGVPERVQSDCCGEETSQMLRSRNSMLNENLIRKCVGHDKDEKLISLKRKRTVVDERSDISITLVDDDDDCNLIVDASPSRSCSNIVGANRSCSKRIRQISLSDMQQDQRKLINNVDQPSSKSNGEQLFTRNKGGKSEESVERPQGNDVESEKIRKQQRSLHLLLKPEIAKLCEILLLPDNVKSMVENCLEYTMSNYQICTKPVSILQAFQLSLCWTAASLLKHKLDFEASLMLAKRHLNFNCKKDMVDEIYSRLKDLKENFLFLTGNSKLIGSPKASESSNTVHSNTQVIPEVELAKRDVSKNQWLKLLRIQEEEKQNLKKDIENEKGDFVRRYKIEWAAIRSCFPNDMMRKEKRKIFNSEYDKRKGELKRQHEIRLKDLEAKQLEARRKFRESRTPNELLSLVASKELGTPQNTPRALVSDHVAEGKSFDNMVEAMARTGAGVRLSEAPDTNSSVVVLCSSPVELQTPLVKHAVANEMDIMASKDGPVSGNKCHNITEDEYDHQGNIISKHSNSREKCSDGATSMANEGEGCENFNRESPNDCGQDTVTLFLLSSNSETRKGETSDVPSGEVALAVHKTSSSNDDQVDISSRQEKLDETILSKPVCGLSIEVKANDFSDGVKNMTSLNSQSPEEHIQSVNTMCMPNCKNAAQIHEADNSNGSNNADTVNSNLSDERISSLNSKSPQEHAHSVNVTCMPNCENSAQIHEDDDSNGSNNVVPVNSPIDERSADGPLVNALDREAHVEMPGTVNFTPSSMEKMSEGAVNVSGLDRVLSRPCETASPSFGLDANATILLNQPSLEKQSPDGNSSSIAAGQNPVEESETNHESTVSELDKAEAVGMPSTVHCTDYPENETPLNSSSTDQISHGGSVLDGVSSSRPCTSSPSNSNPATISLLNPPLQQKVPDRVLLTIIDGKIPVIAPENSHEEAECRLSDSVVVDRSTASDQQEGVHRIITENNLSQENPVSRPVDLIEPPECPHDQDTAQEMQNSLVSSPVDIVPSPTNQSNHVSLVMEPPEQVQQLPSAGFLSSNQDLSNLPLVTGIEDQATNEEALSSHIPEASIEVQNQALEQPASNLDIDSHLHQIVVDPASHLDLDSYMPEEVSTQSSDTGNLSTPGDINNHPIRAATESASRIVPPLCYDPLNHEFERICKLMEQNMKTHEDMKLQLKCDFEKQFEELRRNYEIKHKEIEVEFQKTRKNLDTQLKTVHVHKILAETFRAKSLDLKVSGALGMQQGFAQQLFQLPRHQNVVQPSLVVAPSSRGPSAASLQRPLTPGSQTVLPQATYNTSGIFSSISARLPHINSISSPSGNLQAGGEIRVPAPHLQPYRPSASVPVSSLCAVPHRMPSHPAHSTSVPASSLCTVPHGMPSHPAHSTSVPASSLCTVPHGMPSQPATGIPVPLLHPYRPSTSLPPSSLSAVSYAMLNHPASGDIPVASSSFSHWLSRPMHPPPPPRGHWPESTGGLPTPNLSAVDLRLDANGQSSNDRPNILPRLSDLASLNLSNFGPRSTMPANSPHQSASPDVVCLSDDE